MALYTFKIVLLLLFFGGECFATNAFRVNSSAEGMSRRNEVEIENMPRITSQDGLGICYAHVAATVLQAENCRILNQDCTSLSPSQCFSPLDMARFKAPEPGLLPNNRSTYDGLHVDGGDSNHALIIGGLTVGRIASEECVSIDKILANYDDREEATQLQAQIWERLRKQYDEAKKLARGVDPNCESCLADIYTTAAAKAQDELGRDLNFAVSNISLARAFARNTFSEFLDRAIGANRCDSSQLLNFADPKRKYETYPNDDKATPEMIKNKIRDVLKTGRPVSYGNLCLGDEAPASCKDNNGHAIVVAGYREICNNRGSCRTEFKVINSWGKSWQDRNNAGWVDGDNLLKHTHISQNTLGYFKD